MTFQGLFVDGFAGGGGASTGIEMALGRPVDIAINHCPMAIAIHTANHPTTEHHCQDIRMVWPTAATKHRPVAGAWFSPDCKEHSKAKGGPVKDRSIRQLPWEIIPWLKDTQPLVGYVENVEEMQMWGPLDERGHVIKDLRGKEFQKWLKAIRALGYKVEHKELRACNYGAPTTRKRLYIIMRRDKKPIIWPKPSHAAANDNRVISGELLPFKTAADCIDWTIPCPSIFDRNKDLVENSERRIAHGVMRYVVNLAKAGKQPFMVPLGEDELAAHITKFHSGSVGSAANDPMPTVTSNGQPAREAGAVPLGLVGATLAPFVSYAQHGGASRPVDEPHHTIAASAKDQNCVAAATMVQIGYGEREGQAPRALDITKPLGTAVAGGGKHAAVTAFLSRYYGSDEIGAGGEVRAPLATVRAGGTHHAVVAAHIEQANTGMVGHDLRKPLSTIVGMGSTQRLVETTLVEEGALPPAMMAKAVKVSAFLMKYYGTAVGQPANEPFDTVTTLPRFAVVTVTIDARTYVIVDIGMRMLTPRELARAQGFPDSYILDPECWYTTPSGKRKFGRLPNSYQIRMIGNSVCPDVAAALVRANQPRDAELRLAA